MKNILAVVGAVVVGIVLVGGFAFATGGPSDPPQQQQAQPAPPQQAAPPQPQVAVQCTPPPPIIVTNYVNVVIQQPPAPAPQPQPAPQPAPQYAPVPPQVQYAVPPAGYIPVTTTYPCVPPDKKFYGVYAFKKLPIAGYEAQKGGGHGLNILGIIKIGQGYSN